MQHSVGHRGLLFTATRDVNRCCAFSCMQVRKVDVGPAKCRDMVLDTHQTAPYHDTNPAHYNGGMPLPRHPPVPRQKRRIFSAPAHMMAAEQQEKAPVYRSVFRPKTGQQHYLELVKTRR